MKNNKTPHFGHRTLLHYQADGTGKFTQLGLEVNLFHLVGPQFQMNKVHLAHNAKCDIPWSEFYRYNCTSPHALSL
jgi:hypothetical protein